MEIKDNSALVLAALRQQGQIALKAIGEKAVSYAKKEIQHAGLVDSGKLLHSVNYKIKNDGVYIGTDVKYAAFHELGTGHYTTPHAGAEYGVPAVHFIHHAASRHPAEYRLLLERELKK